MHAIWSLGRHRSMDDLNILSFYNKYIACVVSKPKVPVIVTVVRCENEGSRKLYPGSG